MDGLKVKVQAPEGADSINWLDDAGKPHTLKFKAGKPSWCDATFALALQNAGCVLLEYSEDAQADDMADAPVTGPDAPDDAADEPAPAAKHASKPAKHAKPGKRNR